MDAKIYRAAVVLSFWGSIALAAFVLQAVLKG